MIRALILGLLLSVALQADEKDDIRDALRRAGQYNDIGERIAQLEAEYAATDIWVRKAILLIELADMGDRRVVLPLSHALTDKKSGHVIAFALHGLARLPAEDVRKGGGAELVENLIDALKIKSPYHQQHARQLLTSIVGEDLGKKTTKWKSWLKKNRDDLVVEFDDVRFDDSGFDPDLVSDVMVEGYENGTVLRERIPDCSTGIENMNEYGLDIGLCLDQTSSMTAVIEAAKTNMTVLVAVLAEVVDDYRVGLVTYDDAVKKNEKLTDSKRAIVEMISGVPAEGGGDIPEGVDLALAAALNQDFGWRRRSTKTVIVLGDAPPHAADLDKTLALVEAALAQAKIVTNCVSTGFGEVDELREIAEAGGGQSLVLASPSQLIAEVLLLIFGESMRPSMERFVPVLLDVLGQQ